MDDPKKNEQPESLGNDGRPDDVTPKADGGKDVPVTHERGNALGRDPDTGSDIPGVKTR